MNGQSHHNPADRQPMRFQTTRWSIVADAGHQSAPGSQGALAELCETYWMPLYVYARRRVSDVAEAQDLTQAFFVSFLEKNIPAAADPERGRFRSFLLTAFKNFMAKEWDRDRAKKRGGGKQPLSLNFDAAESGFVAVSAPDLTPEQNYDRQWALMLLERIMNQLAAAHASEVDRFQLLKVFLLSDSPGLSYEDAATKLDISNAAVRKAVSRLRQEYRQLLRDEIEQTVASPELVDEEIRRLFSAFG